VFSGRSLQTFGRAYYLHFKVRDCAVEAARKDEDGGSEFLRNAGKLLWDFMVSLNGTLKNFTWQWKKSTCIV
jgi:hypothetical protein